jgi:hypothetical protein
MKHFQIAEMIAWPDGYEPQKKFWILETNMTVDGPRTRVTDKKFSDRGMAQKYLESVNDPA